MIDEKRLKEIEARVDRTGGAGFTDRACDELIAEVRRLREIEEQMKREHAHHHVPGTTECYGCSVLAKA